MPLDASILGRYQPPPPIDVLGPYKEAMGLQTAQLQQQDIASQIQQRQAQAQKDLLERQQQQRMSQILSQAQVDPNTGAPDPKSPEMQQLFREFPSVHAALMEHYAKVGSESATAAKTRQETALGPTVDVAPGSTVFNKLKGVPDYTAPLTPLQTAETSKATADARKATADAIKTELETGNMPQSVDEAISRLNAIAPPNDKDLGGVNTRFAGLLKAGAQNPAGWGGTLKDALSQADKVAQARATQPIKIEQSLATAQAGAAAATGSGLDLMAEQALNGNFSSRNPALMTKVYQRAAQLAQERGLTSTGVIMAQNAAKANKQALDTLTNQMTQVEAFSQTAAKNMAVLESAIKGVSDLGAPFLNTPVRNLQQQFAGNPRVSAFYAALQPVQTEIAKILNSSNASGVLTDNARNEMQAALGPGATPAQLKAALDIFRQDIENRRSTYKAMQDDVLGKTAVGAGAAGSGTPSFVKPGGALDQLLK